MSNSGKATLENSIKGDIDLEMIGGTEQLTTTGKNLINNNIYTHGYLASVDTGQKISLNTEVKSFATSMDVSSMVGENISISVQTKEKTGKKYAFTDESDTIISGKWDTGSNTYSKFQNIQVPQNAKKLYFSVTYDVQENTELQVELGAKVTTYEPYTGGKPSPSPEYSQEIKSAGKWNEATGKYEIDIILNGSNLWKEDSMIRGHLTADGEIVYKEDGSNCIWTIVVPRDGKYAVRIEKESVGGLYFTRIFNDKISEPYVRLNPGQKGVLTLKKGENKIQASSTSALRPIGNEKVMLSYGDQEPPTYEPYQEPQTLTLASDRPITKWDKLVEQGGQYGWLHGGDIKTFENDVFKLYADNEKAIQYQVPFEEISNSWGELVCYCNTFENAIGQTIYTQSGKTDFYMGCVHKSMVFSAKNKQGIFQNIEAFQEWIRNSGTYVWYKTDNKKFTPLSESEQTQLRNLHSYNGTTHITVDSGEVPCGIKVAYKQKK